MIWYDLLMRHCPICGEEIRNKPKNTVYCCREHRMMAEGERVHVKKNTIETEFISLYGIVPTHKMVEDFKRWKRA